VRALSCFANREPARSEDASATCRGRWLRILSSRHLADQAACPRPPIRIDLCCCVERLKDRNLDTEWRTLAHKLFSRRGCGRTHRARCPECSGSYDFQNPVCRFVPRCCLRYILSHVEGPLPSQSPLKEDDALVKAFQTQRPQDPQRGSA
jgi:hypothetical protein